MSTTLNPPTLYNQDALAARARDLGTLNGIDFALMTLDTAIPPAFGVLELHFFNDQHLDDLVTAASTPSTMWSLLPVTGGERLLAGPLSGQIHVTGLVHSAPNTLEVTLAPVGDYSRYTLTLLQPGFDPVFGQFIFRFRPGCFNSNCKPLLAVPAPASQPAIDYLAKDYDSFRHTMIAAMMQRVPNWQPTSEAAFDVVLLDLFSAAADELSNYQDRVMAEAYITSADKRISLRRHARLMDYFIHEGCQAATVLALDFPGTASASIPAFQQAWTGIDPTAASTVWFATTGKQFVSGLFSRVSLYTWSDAVPALAVGATSADLAFASFADATSATGLINDGSIRRLLLEERLNPATGNAADRDPTRRQIVSLTGASLLTDPLTGDPVVRVTWSSGDALTRNFCFVASVNGKRVPDVSLFHGNVLDTVQGKRVSFDYVPAGVSLAPAIYPLTTKLHGASECRLPPAFPVLWTPTTPGGVEPSVSTVEITVADASGTSVWMEQPDLIHSEGTDRHFVVEADELLRSLVRFGDGSNGAALPDDPVVTCSWLSGYGPDGNIGRDALRGFGTSGIPAIAGRVVWNPFDVTGGLAPETPDVIRRRVPEAFLYHQTRAVTLDDYIARALEVHGVSNAAAFCMWTGSWRTVRVVIDPAGTNTLTEALRGNVEARLDAVHLIGEDVEVRAPEYVPLIIEIDICVSSGYWIDDVAPVVEAAFSTSYTPAGEMAFFNPDRWTFGQALYASQMEGVLATIPGVEHVVSIRMMRWWNQSVVSSEVMRIAPEEIVLVSNDPSRIELGSITFTWQGGQQ